MSDDLSNVREALKSAEDELAQLNRRRAVLQAFITSGYRLLGESQPIDPSRRKGRGQGIHIYLEPLLRECPEGLSVQELTHTLISRGLIEGRWAREVIRNALNRGTQFQRVRPGVYVLKG
jgi:hypothetical protein